MDIKKDNYSNKLKNCLFSRIVSFLASQSRAGRAKTDGLLAMEEDFLDMVADQPSRSTRTVARQLHVSHSTTW